MLHSKMTSVAAVTRYSDPDMADVMLNHIDESDRNGNVDFKATIKQEPADGICNSATEKDHSTSGKHHSSSDKNKSSSSDRHKHGSSSDKHRSSHSSSDKHKSSSSDKHRSSSSGDKHKSSSSSGDKHKSSSSSSGDKHKSSSSSGDKHRSSSSSGDKHKSSSSSGDKHRSSSSSGDKHKSSSSSGDKHRSSSSSSKHKSSSSDKHRDKHHSIKAENCDDDGDKSLPLGSPTEMETSGAASPSGATLNHMDEKLALHASVDIKRETDERIGELMNVSQLSASGADEDESQSDEDETMHVKTETLSDDDDNDATMPERSPAKRKYKEEDSDDDYEVPKRSESAKKKAKSDKKKEKKRKSEVKEEYDDDSPDEEPKKKKKKTAQPKASTTPSPQKGRKPKKEEEQLTDVWRWWEEEKTDNSIKWKFLEHKGPVFADAYVPLPKDVKFYYNGKEMRLEPESEEVMTYYGRMLHHDYTTKEVFNANFFKDWRKTMTLHEKEIITDLKKCNFTEVNDYFQRKTEERKNRSKEEKAEEKKKNEALIKEYGTAVIDGYRQKIGNFKTEPPSLFRGRGEHPKMGCLKRRIWPKDVIINCSKDSKIPVAPFGQSWKEVRHDNTVTWLASWTENVQGQTKYIMLNASSRLKGEKDWQKYETARKLHKCVDKIRASYREDMSSKEMRIRQRSVAMYFIDKLALRAGNEKDEDTADTVGCCTLRVEHIRLHDELGGKQFVVEFDFLGKDSMRYQNQVAVDKRAFKNLKLFMTNKQPGDDLFDRLNTSILNKHLTDLMEGLTAKVFRTYNASKTLQDQLELLTNEDDPPASKLLSYNRANRAVAILCNHQRSVPKSFGQQMENLQTKITQKRAAVKDAKKQVKAAKSDVKNTKNPKAQTTLTQKKKLLARLEDQLTKLEVSATDKDENKDIALGTSKLNYLDPRISVAWCKRFDMPIEKVYNKTQREKFQWAIDMATADFYF